MNKINYGGTMVKINCSKDNGIFVNLINFLQWFIFKDNANRKINFSECFNIYIYIDDYIHFVLCVDPFNYRSLKCPFPEANLSAIEASFINSCKSTEMIQMIEFITNPKSFTWKIRVCNKNDRLIKINFIYWKK